VACLESSASDSRLAMTIPHLHSHLGKSQVHGAGMHAQGLCDGGTGKAGGVQGGGPVDVRRLEDTPPTLHPASFEKRGDRGPMDAVLGGEFKDGGTSQVILDKLVDFLVPKPSLVLSLGYRIPEIHRYNPNL